MIGIIFNEILTYSFPRLFLQVNKNEEIKNIVNIMGLKFDVEYDETNVKTLRYGHLMIMADQVCEECSLN